jgi:HK97 family phage portal protein
VAILDAGAKFQPITMPNNDAQFIESRDFQVSEVSRWFGVPPFLLNQTEKSTSWGTGLEQQATGFVKFDLHPAWLAPTEARVTKELTGSGIYAKYKVEGLLRGDTSRAPSSTRHARGRAFSAERHPRARRHAAHPDGGGHLPPAAQHGPIGLRRDTNAPDNAA